MTSTRSNNLSRMAPKYDARGLVPAIAQDWRTGRVLMLAWMSPEAWDKTLETGRATYWSRSRQALWVKGETSGYTQRVVEVRLDCDGDTVLLQVEQEGPACHTGAATCFFYDHGGAEVSPSPGGIVERLAAVLTAKAAQTPDSSYTARLIHKGIPKINAKITEEAGELCEALAQESDERVVSELADVLYHALVGLVARGIDPNAVWLELGTRFGVSGLMEKASRTPKA